MFFLDNFSTIIRSLLIIFLFSPGLLNAHNNPEFTNKPVTSVEVNPGAASDCNSKKFSLDLPKETVRVVLDINSENKDNITFSIRQGDEVIAKDVKNGSEINPDLFNGDPLKIISVKGTESIFKLNLLSRVIVKKKKKNEMATKIAAGKKVYKKDNCVGCHKWHGDGGGGYGGKALSLRTTPLDAKLIKYVIRCGRPKTGMPYHGRNSYKKDDKSCYESTREELGDDLPHRARNLMSERELNAVVNYVVTVIKGSGEPNLAQCVAFWGEKSRQCDSFKK